MVFQYHQMGQLYPPILLITALLLLSCIPGEAQYCSCPSNGCSQNPSRGACQRSYYVQYAYHYTAYYYVSVATRWAYKCRWGWGRTCYRTEYKNVQKSRWDTAYRSAKRCSSSCCSGYTGAPNCRPVCIFGCSGGTCIGPNICRCYAQWSGVSCRTPVCSPACANGGQCTSPGSCSCNDQWSGPRCLTPVCTPACANGGTCTKPGTCACAPNWTGSRCEKPLCNPPCATGGQCEPNNKCTCAAGWTGERCDQAVCSPACANGGQCTSPGTCSCTDQWSGPRCLTPVCTPACANGGQCEPNNKCTCAAGWTGERCDQAVCSSACANGGQCTSPGTCSCTDQWSGPRCLTPVCTPACANGGTCTKPGRCACTPNWIGRRCKKSLCHPPCATGGQCEPNNKCTCAAGWTGERCDQAVCSSACANGGQCTSPGTCSCTDQWSGPRCLTPVCTPACANGGTCTKPGTCACTPSWIGRRCKKSLCHPPCATGGQCEPNNKCTCAAGWTGERCDQAVCNPSCVNGDCTAGGVCMCSGGWSGPDCSLYTVIDLVERSQNVYVSEIVGSVEVCVSLSRPVPLNISLWLRITEDSNSDIDVSIVGSGSGNGQDSLSSVAEESEDYSLDTDMLTLYSGQLEGCFSVAIVDDDLVEGPETFEFEVVSVNEERFSSQGLYLYKKDGAVRIISDDVLTVQFAQTEYRVSESARVLLVDVIASGFASFDYVVDLLVHNDTAVQSEDFELTTASASFSNDGSTRSTVSIDIRDNEDEVKSNKETFHLTLSLQNRYLHSGIRLANMSTTTTVVIFDYFSDTSVPRNILVTFERTSYRAVEGRVVTINLVANATVPLSYTVEVSVMDISASYGIDYSLAAAEGGGPAPTSATEGVPTTSGPTRPPPTSGSTRPPPRPASQSNVAPGSLNITFSSNQEMASFVIVLHRDSVVERNESFRCSISGIYLIEELENVILMASKDYTHVTIIESNTLYLKMNFSSDELAMSEEQRLFRVGENASTITIHIASSLVTSFDYQVELYAEGTASNGSDFVLPRFVLFPANQSQVDVDILIVDDSTAESPVERSTVELRVVPGNPSISVSPDAASLSIEILDDDFCQQNLLFPVTQTGRTASVPCGLMVQVDGDSRMIGQMTAKCGMDTVWGPANMSACTFRKGAASGNIVWVVELRGINLTMLWEEIAQSLDSGMRKRAIAEDAPKVVINLLQEATSSSGDSYSLQFHAQVQLGTMRNSLNNSIISEVTLQRNAGCDCCSINQVPLTTGARALRICEGTAISAPLACSCWNGSNVCQPRFDYSPSFGCHLDTDRDGVPDVNDTCVGCCVEEVNIFSWPETDHGSFVEVDCSQLHPSFGNSTVRRNCKTNDTWDPVDLRSCTFTNNTDRSAPMLVFNATLNGINTTEIKEQLRQQAIGLLSDNATNQTVVVTEVTIINTTKTSTPSSPSPQQQVVLFIVQYGQNAELKQGFSAALKSNSSAFVFVEAVIPSDNCECVSNSSQDVRRLCIGTSAPPCGCSSAGTCNVCVDPYTEDDDGSCTLDRDGDEIPDHKDPCPAVFGTTCAGPTALSQTSQLCERDTDEEWKLTWRRTARVKFRTQRCPGGVENSAGLAKRTCSGVGKWEEVDVSGCVSRNFLRISDSNMEVNRALNSTRDSNLPLTVEEVAVAVSVVAMLSTAMRDSAQTNNSILPGDLDIATEVVSEFARLSENNKLFDTGNVTEKTTIVKSVANVFSDVLDSTNNAAFGSTTEQSQAVSLLDSAEQLARSGFTSLSDVNSSTPTNDSQGQQGELVQRNIAIQTNRLNTSLLAGTNFTFPKLSEESLNAFKNSDQVPLVNIPGDFVQALIQVTANSINEVNVVSFTLNNIQNHLSGELIDQEDYKKRRSSELASLVVSSQISEAKRTGIDSVDGPKVQLSFPMLSDVYDKVESTLAADERMEVRCAAWNFTGGPEGKGGWSFAGIEVVSYNRTAVECTSTHLTSFCVLVSVLPPEKSAATEAFSVITYIGCSISLVCLLLSIVFFLSLRKELITRLHNFVHLNLCIALSLGLIVFIAGLGHATEFQGACVFVSVLLHYFFLAAFSWMLCEAVMIYILLVKVFGANERKWIYMYLGLGWGIPVPIVVVSVASRHYEYFITDETGMIFSCWLPVKDGVIAAFIVPMLAILLINAVLLTLSLVSLAKSKCGRSKEVKMEDKENLQTAWQLTKATLILLPLMGFTWIIGLLAVGPGRLGVEIVFILLNSLQGLFIFILHVVRHEKVWSKIKSRLSSIRSEKSTFGSGHSSAAKYTLHRSTLKRSIFSKISTMSSQNTSTLKSQSEGVCKPLDNGDDEDTKGSLHDNHEQIEMKEGTNATNEQTTDEPVAVETASSSGRSDVVTGTTRVSVGDAKTDLPVNGERNQTFSDQAQDPSHKDNDSMQDTKADNGDSPTSL